MDDGAKYIAILFCLGLVVPWGSVIVLSLLGEKEIAEYIVLGIAYLIGAFIASTCIGIVVWAIWIHGYKSRCEAQRMRESEEIRNNVSSALSNNDVHITDIVTSYLSTDGATIV